MSVDEHVDPEENKNLEELEKVLKEEDQEIERVQGLIEKAKEEEKDLPKSSEL
jgi:hypothetical protein